MIPKNLLEMKAFIGGTYVEQMPSLISEGFAPLRIREIIELILEGRISFLSSIPFFDSVSGIAYAGDKQDKFKIIPCSQDLERINLQTKLAFGGKEFTQEQYYQIMNEEFSRQAMPLNRDLTEKEALEHLGWLELVEGDRKLLEKYVEYAFRQALNKWGMREAMEFRVDDPWKISNIKDCLLFGIGGSGSFNVKTYSLRNDPVCLLGVKIRERFLNPYSN